MIRGWTRRALVANAASAVWIRGLRAQQAERDPDPVPFVCPMDPDVRSKEPGKCPKCGMKLLVGLPDPEDYPVKVEVTPRAWKAGGRVSLRFRALHPKTGRPVTKFLEVHERLWHLFVIGEDLRYFAHEHPERQQDGSFLFETVLPEDGMYRLLSDFFPEGGTPQLVASTLLGAGPRRRAALAPDMAPKQADNLRVALRTEPEAPLAGKKTMLFFELDTAEGLEPFLGAWGHLLAASADLLDMIHAHPAFPEPGRQIQFNVIFPRPGVHKVWVQFQRQGVVNTVAFQAPVGRL